MIGLDTNVVVRLLTQDDVRQSRRVDKLIATAQANADPLYLSVIVLCEVAWVLRSAYGYQRDDVVRAIEALLAVAEIVIEDRDLTARALLDYKHGPADLSDYLIGYRNNRAGCHATATFDRKLSTSKIFSVLR